MLIKEENLNKINDSVKINEFSNLVKTDYTKNTSIQRLLAKSEENQASWKAKIDLVDINSIMLNCVGHLSGFTDQSKEFISDVKNQIGTYILPPEENQTEPKKSKIECPKPSKENPLGINYKEARKAIKSAQEKRACHINNVRRAALLKMTTEFGKYSLGKCIASTALFMRELEKIGIPPVSEKTIYRDFKFLNKIGLLERKTSYNFRKKKKDRIINTFSLNTLEEDLLYIFSLLNKVIYSFSSKYSDKKYLQERKPADQWDCVTYFISVLKKSGTEAIRFFEYWTALNWIDRLGNSIKDWRSLAFSWKSFF